MKHKASRIALLAFVCSTLLVSTGHAELNIFDPNWTVTTKEGYHYGIQGYQFTSYLVWGSHSVHIPLSAHQSIGIFAALVCGCVCLSLLFYRILQRKRVYVAKPCAAAR